MEMEMEKSPPAFCDIPTVACSIHICPIEFVFIHDVVFFQQLSSHLFSFWLFSSSLHSFLTPLPTIRTGSVVVSTLGSQK